MDDSLNQFWYYNRWANEKVLESFDHYGEQLPYSCLHLFSHIANTQLSWLSRVKGEKIQVDAWKDHTLEECRTLIDRTSEELKKEIENLSFIIDGRKIEYSNSKGLTFQNDVDDILFHVFNHGTYHRAQIAQEARRNGLEPVNTDYITFVR